MTKPERIAKRIARAGVCSRRKAETLIVAGQVTVNGDVISSPALNVNSSDKICVNGKPLAVADQVRLWRYHKPKGLICSHDDPQGRKSVFQDLKEKELQLPDHLISVGRLDFNSEGVLLLTNSGDLSRHLELPDTAWIRTYRVRVLGHPDPEKLQALKNGIVVDGIKYGSVQAQIDKKQGANCWIIIKLKEGKNREIRKIMEYLGYPVNRLIRVAYGPFLLGNLIPGEVQEVPQKVLRDQLGQKTIDLL